MFTDEERTLIVEGLLDKQTILTDDFARNPKADWIRCRIHAVLELIRKVNRIKVIELRLCESVNLGLRADTLYRFTIDQTCEGCKRLDAASRA